MTIMLMLGAALLAPASSSSSTSGSLTIDGIAAATADGMIPLSVTAGDLDGDGAADRGTLLIRCDGGAVANALFHNVKSPRDAASGLATGRRTHVVPHVFDKASARLAGIRPHYDIKEAKGARAIVGMGGKKGYDAYQALSLHGVGDLCPAATSEAAKVKATKSRSNIQNN